MYDYLRNTISQNFIYLCLHQNIFDTIKKTKYCFCLKSNKSDCEAGRSLEAKWAKELVDEIMADKWEIIYWSCHIGFLWLSLIIELNEI